MTEVVTLNEDKITTEVVTLNEDKITTEVVTLNWREGGMRSRSPLGLIWISWRGDDYLRVGPVIITGLF